jgi:hypothetical protein
LKVTGVRFVPHVVKAAKQLQLLPLAAAWRQDTRDPLREEMLAVLHLCLQAYAASA